MEWSRAFSARPLPLSPYQLMHRVGNAAAQGDEILRAVDVLMGGVATP